MNRLKIIGTVVAIHVAVFMFIFAIPGCRSTGKAAGGETAAAPISPVSGSASPIVPVGPAPAARFDPDAPAMPRVSPTRPGTPAADALLLAAPAAPSPVAAAPVTYTVKSNDSLWTIAKNNHLSVDALATANHLSASTLLKVGQKLLLPGKPAAGTASADSTTVADAETTAYTVKAGESLGAIAQRSHTTADALKKLNNLHADTVHAGDKLRLPAPGITKPALPATAGSAPAGGITHVVKARETLGEIARNRVGQELKIPGSQPAGDKAAPPGQSSPVPDAVTPIVPVAASSPGNLTLPSLQTPARDAAGVTATGPAADTPIIKIEDSGAPKIP